VNIKKNINSIEYASIGLSAIGTVAAVITQQIAYIATPLTLALSLSLIDRQKELGKATKRLTDLEQQSQTVRDSVNALSSAPAPIYFENLQQNIIDNRQELKRIETVLFELEKRDNDPSPFLTEINLTKDSIKQLGVNFSNFQKQFNDSQVSIRVASTDRSTEEVTGNLNNDISADFSDIEIIDNTPLLEDRISKSRKIDESTIYSSIEELKSKLYSLEENSIVAEGSIKQIGWRFLDLEKAFDDRQDPIEIANIQQSLSGIENNVSSLAADVSISKTAYILQIAELERDRDNINLSIEEIESKLQSLAENLNVVDIYDRISDMDASLCDLHDYQLKLNNRIDRDRQYKINEIVDTVFTDKKIGELIQQEIDLANRSQLEIVKQLLPKQYSYVLVSGRSASRQIFLEALDNSQQRLILVCPWLTNYAVDTEAKYLIRSSLERGVSIDIGWGNLKDVDNDRANLSKEKVLKLSKRKSLYSAIPWMYELQTEYADLLNLKVLGTHEKFLVCDRKFAMLGSHNYMTSNTRSSERELGVKTDSPETIDKLIELFDRVSLQ
jgi:hypothetical protein